MVLTVYPHHLLMDFVMPTWALVAGQVISWLSGLPVLLVTAFGARQYQRPAPLRGTPAELAAS